MAELNRKTRYSDEELDEFRILIEDKLENAKIQLGYYLQQLSEMADNPDSKVKGLDDGAGSLENENITNLAVRQKKHIQHLENALIRIKNKMYGVCRISGKLISKDRLRAVPHATLSINAKKSR